MADDPQNEMNAADEQLAPESGDVAVAEEVLPSRQYCMFRAGRERYCLEVTDIEEVLEWPTVTPLPLAPTFLCGVFNLRGSIVPIIDIAFTEGHRGDLPPKHVVVARLKSDDGEGSFALGIASDEVVGTHTTSEPLLVDEAPKDVPHCCGMLRYSDRLALALDLSKVLESFPVPVI